MILSTDTSALQGSRLLPQSRNSIASMVGVRAATLATAQYASYAGNATDTLIQYTFAGGNLVVGNQVRLLLYGTSDNASGGTETFSPQIRCVQDASLLALGIVYQTPAGNAAWVIDAALSFSTPGSPNASSSKLTNGVYTSGTRDNSQLSVGGMLRLTNKTSTPSYDQDLITTTNPSALILNNTQPVSIVLNIVAGDVQYTVQGGWMEAM